ncbi:hypothetical protein PENTCL1PPCAC_21379, partial [Pristionchus entomophagus]
KLLVFFSILIVFLVAIADASHHRGSRVASDENPSPPRRTYPKKRCGGGHGMCNDATDPARSNGMCVFEDLACTLSDREYDDKHCYGWCIPMADIDWDSKKAD